MKNRTNKITACAILIAVTAVLQTLAAVFPLKVFGLSVSLVMIPIAVAAIFFGYTGGISVGLAFGITVFIHCITGLDPTGAMLFGINPFFTALATVLRGLLVGIITSAVFNALKKLKNDIVKYVITAVVAPTANTTIFVVLFALLFNDTLKQFAQDSGQSVFSFLILSMVGVNFLFELLTTALITPPVCKAISKYRRKP